LGGPQPKAVRRGGLQAAFAVQLQKIEGINDMLRKTVLTSAVLLLASLTAFAANNDRAVTSKNGVEISKDGTMAFATQGTFQSSTPDDKVIQGLTPIYDNLNRKYPDGTYFCCDAPAIWGPNNPAGLPENWRAAAFTPSVSLNVTVIQVPVSWINFGETDTNVIISLNADDGTGLPGASLEAWNAQIGNNPLGSCCEVTTKKSTGIPVTAGSQYWIVVGTGNSSDVVAGWNPNDTLELSSQDLPAALWCSSNSGECNPNNAWALLPPGVIHPAPAFAVYGQ
jgi:hypothetical protein